MEPLSRNEAKLSHTQLQAAAHCRAPALPPGCSLPGCSLQELSITPALALRHTAKAVHPSHKPPVSQHNGVCGLSHTVTYLFWRQFVLVCAEHMMDWHRTHQPPNTHVHLNPHPQPPPQVLQTSNVVTCSGVLVCAEPPPPRAVRHSYTQTRATHKTLGPSLDPRAHRHPSLYLFGASLSLFVLSSCFSFQYTANILHPLPHTTHLPQQRNTRPRTCSGASLSLYVLSSCFSFAFSASSSSNSA